MESNGFKSGLLFTADPYSKIVDPDDKNTAMLFGDAATVTLISDEPQFVAGKFSFGTSGKEGHALSCKDGTLEMNGRAVFSFSARTVPLDVRKVVEGNDLNLNDIDKFVFHQGSKYIVDTISQRLGLPAEKVAFDMYEYGNTVSSSIPLILESEIMDANNNHIVISGFGVGLSWASTVLNRA